MSMRRCSAIRPASRLLALVVAFGFATNPLARGSVGAADRAASARVEPVPAACAELPMAFEASVGQTDARATYGAWEYRVARTGQVFSGTANLVRYVPRRSLSSSDTDDPRVAMGATLNYSTNTGTVQVTDRRTGRRYTLRDRNLANTPCP